MVLLSSAKSPKCVTAYWLSECDHSGLAIDDQTRSPFKRYLRWTFDVTCQDIWNDRFVSTSDISINLCRSFLRWYITRPASYATTNRTEVLWSALMVNFLSLIFYPRREMQMWELLFSSANHIISYVNFHLLKKNQYFLKNAFNCFWPKRSVSFVAILYNVSMGESVVNTLNPCKHRITRHSSLWSRLILAGSIHCE